MLVMPSPQHVSRVLKGRHADGDGNDRHIDVFCMRIQRAMQEWGHRSQTCGSGSHTKVTLFLGENQYYVLSTFTVRHFLDYEQDLTSSTRSFAPVRMRNVRVSHLKRKPWIFMLYAAYNTAWTDVLQIKHVYDTCDSPSSAQTLLHACTHAYLTNAAHALVSKLCVGQHFKVGLCLDHDDLLYDHGAPLRNPVLARLYILLSAQRPKRSPHVVVGTLKHGLEFRKNMTRMVWRWDQHCAFTSVMSLERIRTIVCEYGGCGCC